jgi:arylsulfatase A-like enzyme
LKSVFFDNKQLAEKRFLYWEFHEQGGKQAVRWGNWKGVRLNVHNKGFHEEIELYDLENDVSESVNVASENQDVVKTIMGIMASEHEFSETFPFDFEKNN